MPQETRCRDEWLLRVLETRHCVDPDTARQLRAFPFASVELLRRGLLSRERLAEALWDNYHIPFQDPSASLIERLAATLVPASLCRRLNILPLRVEGDSIDVLTADPLDESALQEVQLASGRQPRPVYCLPQHIEELIAEIYGTDTIVYDLLKKLPETAAVEVLDCDESDESGSPTESIAAPIIRLANQLVAQAVFMKASDIHIEHEEGGTVVRYRIDGVLRTVMSLPKHIGNGPLVSRIKIMSNLDVADRRRAQDGRAKLRVGGQDLGLRVSSIPTAFGEKVVLRILDPRQAQLSLESLGFRSKAQDAIASLSESRQGLLLVTGPTGSGKTTTLYSLINRLKSDGVNVVTVEDPIEYRLPGINQIQVHEKAGLGFAAILRSVLRQDPDIILVGEIRDKETADIAFQAALTGHMVLSTLHTNDALSTINRLIDMGVERFKLAPALVGVISQRLVRRVCDTCKGKGCEACLDTGLRGRIALCEVLDLRGPEAKTRLGVGASLEGFEAAALQKGWLQRICDDALWHLQSGETTPEEVIPYLSAASVQPPGPCQTVASGVRRRILIVDDCEDNRLLVRDTLKSEDFVLVEAADGAAALSSVQEQRPDLILLDLMMPGIDGFAVIERLRAESNTAEIPIMVLTAMGEAESQAMCLELGADDYMIKPFHPKVLRARVQALFRRRKCQEIPCR